MKKFLPLLFLFISLTGLAQKVLVKRVIDGDTYVTENGDKVRMTGINAPEMNTYFGEAAKKYLEELINGKYIELKKDKQTGNKDKYDRLLRYTLLDGRDINKKMVCDGYAIAYTRFKFSKSKEYKACEKDAKANHIGVWANDSAESLYYSKINKKGNKPPKKPATTENQPQKAEEKDTLAVTLKIISGAILLVLVILIPAKRKKRRRR